MASSFVTCTANTWTIVATAITIGVIHKVNSSPNMYLQAFVPTGDPAPIGRNVGVDAFKDSISNATVSIQNSSQIDVYLWVDNVDGEVRVDI